ncbi:MULTISPECIES: hypothetical protein [unclassified Streptomyces]|uniref:phosphotriesterase family protein n=1 Tax=unclassified Streptomyces TaxID=2593676 RepID=UPI00035E2782|nr:MULTISPECIES: hypothetical protein [unclassified Streptomyces]MYT30106.1 phosphotriesterase [Streptomyces sp. SID8354]
MHHVHTVCGPLRASAVQGPVLSHEHLALDLSRDTDPEAVLLPGTHGGRIAAELARLREEHGLALVIELSCRGMGRDPQALRRISQTSGVAVVTATGWYHEAFHPPELAAADPHQLTAILVDEIEHGIGRTGIRPGVIGEVGSHRDQPTDAERHVLTAAAHAAAATGRSVATHAHLGRGGPAQLEILTSAGLPAHRASIGHQDLLDDPAVHRELASAGAYVAFDTIGKENYTADSTRLRLLLALLEAGHADQVLLSCDISRHRYLRSEGGQGYGHLFRSFLPKARAAGIDDDTIDAMTRRNPLRFLLGSQVKRVTRRRSCSWSTPSMPATWVW